MSDPQTTTVVVMGVSGSGKTTIAQELARRLGRQLVEGDDLHPPQNVAKMAAGHPLDDDDRWPWLDRVAEGIGVWEQTGQDGIVTCSALKRSYRDRLRAGHPSVWFAHVDAHEQVLRDRLARRTGHYMPPSLLDSQLATLQRLAPDEAGATVDGDAPCTEVVTALLDELRRQGRPLTVREDTA